MPVTEKNGSRMPEEHKEKRVAKLTERGFKVLNHNTWQQKDIRLNHF